MQVQRLWLEFEHFTILQVFRVAVLVDTKIENNTERTRQW